MVQGIERLRFSQGEEASRRDGKTRSLPRDRAIVMDVLREAKSVPSFGVERWFQVDDVAEVRSQIKPRISWLALFAKAYCLTCREIPVLRQTLTTFPWPRVYQAPSTILTLAVNRKFEDREQLFFGRIRNIEEHKLTTIQTYLDSLASDEVEKIFQQQLMGCRLPAFVRRLGWIYRNLIPKQRAKSLGTCSISVLASEGVYNRTHPNVLTSSLTYGPIEGGRMWITLLCDHRLLDGKLAARAINLMDEQLRGVVFDELKELKADTQRRLAAKPGSSENFPTRRAS